MKDWMLRSRTRMMARAVFVIFQTLAAELREGAERPSAPSSHPLWLHRNMSSALFHEGAWCASYRYKLEHHAHLHHIYLHHVYLKPSLAGLRQDSKLVYRYAIVTYFNTFYRRQGITLAPNNRHIWSFWLHPDISTTCALIFTWMASDFFSLALRFKIHFLTIYSLNINILTLTSGFIFFLLHFSYFVVFESGFQNR